MIDVINITKEDDMNHSSVKLSALKVEVVGDKHTIELVQSSILSVLSTWAK